METDRTVPRERPNELKRNGNGRRSSATDRRTRHQPKRKRGNIAADTGQTMTNESRLKLT